MNMLKKIVKWVKNHKFRTAIVVVAVIVVGLIIKKVLTPPQVETTVVSQGSINQVIEASGSIAAHQSVDLSFVIPGKVVWVGAHTGDQVKAYQTLATLDQRSVQKSIQVKLLDYMTTRWNFDQTRDDYNVDGHPLDSLTLTDAEKRILQKSQFGLDQSVLDYEIANLAREQSYLVTPIAGTLVDDANLTPGENLAAAAMATRVLHVVNLNTLYFQANIDEVDYPKIALDQPVIIKLDSSPNATYGGKVSLIGQQGVKKTGGTVQVPVEITFDQIPPHAIPLLNGDVQIILSSKPDALLLPKKFVRQTNAGGYEVSVLSGRNLVSKPVEVGIIGTNNYEITSGLQAGDTVVVPAKS